MILGFLIKKPKLLLVVIALALLYWFTIGKNSGGNDMISQLAGFTTGAKFDPKLYDKAEVYEPLADNVKNPLPERASLEAFCPPRMNQGQQGSCVAWASAYAARTIVQAKATNADPKSSAFSPSYLYNQIKIDNSDCQGSYIFRAMDTMLKGGALPFSKFGYTDQNCSKQPTAEEKQQALPYRIKGFQRLTLGADEQRTDMLAMKQQLSQGSPIVIGMMVGGTFMRGMEGQDVWIPTDADYEQRGFYELELPNDPLPHVVSRNRSVMRPYGAWAVIAPFNFPLALAGGPTAAALVTGNTVVVKGATDTPWAGRLLADCIRDAGLPPGVFQYLSGSGREVGEALSAHPATAGITFTGSVAVGTQLLQRMAAGPWPRAPPCRACTSTARWPTSLSSACVRRSTRFGSAIRATVRTGWVRSSMRTLRRTTRATCVNCAPAALR